MKFKGKIRDPGKIQGENELEFGCSEFKGKIR